MQNSLLIKAIPYVDESPLSFLLRTTKLNAHSSIFNLVGKGNYQCIIKKSLNYNLADAVRFSLILNTLNIESNYSYLAFKRSGPTNRSFRTIGSLEVPNELLELNKIRYCPVCLAENMYFKKLWMLKPIFACPIHSCLLVDLCPNCKNPIILKSGVQNCDICSFELHKTQSKKIKAIKSIYWFIDILNSNSTKIFKDFAACWNAFNEFFKLDGTNTDLKVFLSVHEYFHDSKASALKLSALINSKIKFSHPRIQLMPFLKFENLFKEHIKVVEQNANEYKISEKSISRKIRNHQIKKILKISRFELEKLIEADFLNLGKKELYRRNISSIDIERYIIKLNNKTKIIPHNQNKTNISNNVVDIKEISQFLKINYETSRKLANYGWFNFKEINQKSHYSKKYSKKNLYEFNRKYIVVSALAKNINVNPTNLVDKLKSISIMPIHGPHIDSTPINIFLKSDVQAINLNDLKVIKNYPTHAGRKKDKKNSINTPNEYYQLKEAAILLGISTNKIAVLIKKGILCKNKENPHSVQIQASSLLDLHNKLNCQDYVTYLQASKQLNCPINWMKRYWCDTGFLNIEDLIYWKLIRKNELAEVLKLKKDFITGAEASALLGMRHSHITNLTNQGLIRPYYFGNDNRKVRLFRKIEVLKL